MRKIKAKVCSDDRVEGKYWVGYGTVTVVRMSGDSSCKMEGSEWLGVAMVLIDQG